MNRHIVGGLLSLLFLLSIACAGQAPLSPRAVMLNQAGVEALEDGDLVLARARFAIALEYHPRFVDALVNLALVEIQQGNFDLARRKLDEAVSLNRHIAQPHHGLGLLEEQGERWAKAAEHYQEALRVDPGFFPSRANLARIYFESGQLDHARDQFLRLVQVAPEQPLGYAGLADCLYRLGRKDEAENVVIEAVERLGNDAPAIRIHHARMMLEGSKTKEAMDLLAPLTEQKGPASRDAWAWLGVALLLENNLDKALKCAEQALAHDRNHPLGTYVLAIALSKRADPHANPWLERAQQLAPGNSVITSLLDRDTQK